MSSSSIPGVLHRYAPRLVAFEHHPATAENKLLFIGGLGDGLGSVPFVDKLDAIDGWSVVEVLVTSSYKGWGTSSVMRDAEELAQCMKYFKKLSSNKNAKIVLMGHSTGSQDTMQCLVNSEFTNGQKLDGAILQAPVSDREALVATNQRTAYLTALNFAESWIKNGQGSEVVPRQFRPGMEDTAVTAERWFSIAAPLDVTGKPQGAEDFFSSDISDTTLKYATFGRIPSATPLLILYSADDQFVPPTVNKTALVTRWIAAAQSADVTVHELSGVVPGANHTLDGVGEDVMADFVQRIRAFLGTIAIPTEEGA